MPTLILNQDRDQYIPFNGELHTFPALGSKNKVWGINLYTGKHLLGTFDSVKEILSEIHAIRSCTHDIYCVKGFSDFDITEHLMLEDEVNEILN